MTPTDHPDADPRFEAQVAGALRERGARIDVSGDGRVAIDRRIGQRSRDRRVRRIGVLVVVLVALLLAVSAAVRPSHRDSKVVTVPGPTVVPLPQLGLPSSAGRNRLYAYVPGRSVNVAVGPNDAPDWGSTSAPSSSNRGQTPGGGVLRIAVTDASVDQVRASLSTYGSIGAVESTSVNGKPGELLTIKPIAPGTVGAVVWQVAPHAVATLTVPVSSPTGSPGQQAASMAAELVELDDATWWALLNPPEIGAPAGVLALTGDAGASEISDYNPKVGDTQMVLDAPGFAPGTFRLASSTRPSGSDLVNDGQVPEYALRGTTALLMSGSSYGFRSGPFTAALVWRDGNGAYQLDFTDAASPEDAAQVAEHLSVPTADEWRSLLLPSALRTDLVPMPDFSAATSPSSTGG